MPKTPDEVKKGLECCTSRDCGGNKCPYFNEKSCNAAKSADALVLIQQLEDGLMNATGCRECKHFNNDAGQVPEICMRCRNYSNWQWRGVQKEE